MTNKDFQPTAPKYFFAEKSKSRFIRNKAGKKNASHFKFKTTTLSNQPKIKQCNH
jgi:hypothetical protein